MLENADTAIRHLPLYFPCQDLRSGERLELSIALVIASRPEIGGADLLRWFDCARRASYSQAYCPLLRPYSQDQPRDPKIGGGLIVERFWVTTVFAELGLHEDARL